MSFKNVNTQVDENLKKYLNGEHNVLKGDMLLFRNYRNGKEISDVYYGDSDKPIHSGYNMRSRKPKQEVASIDIRQEHKPINEISKGTGGQLAYVKLIVKEKKLIKGLSPAACSIILHMCFEGIQWNTGKLMQDNKKPHTAQSIANIIKMGLRATKTALKELVDRDIVQYDKKHRAYFMSARIAMKGVVMDENKV